MVHRTQGFSSVSRLKKAAEFKNIFDSPFRSVDKQFIVLAKPNKLPTARLGLAISKKRVRLAVTRNRIKRLIRESFRYNQNDLSGLDMVVMVQKNVATVGNCRMTESLHKHWKKVAQCAR